MSVMNSFELLGPIASELHREFRNLFYMLLPIFFSLSILFAWFKNPLGGADFLEAIKRTVIATLLVVGYVEICDTILLITNGVSDRISDMSGIDSIFQMAGDKLRNYPKGLVTAVFAPNDLLLSILAFLSWAILYFARFLMLAVYHFAWTFLTILAPVILLFHLFSPRITLNFFRTLIEVASWQIVWATLSAMLKALPFHQAYATDGSYITLIFLNFVIAICLFLTPLIVRAIVGNGFSAMASSLTPLAATSMMALPGKTKATLNVARSVLSLSPSPSPSHRPIYRQAYYAHSKKPDSGREKARVSPTKKGGDSASADAEKKSAPARSNAMSANNAIATYANAPPPPSQPERK